MGKKYQKFCAVVSTNRFRSVTATTSLVIAIILTFVNLGIAVSHPSAALSWAKFRADVNIRGTLTTEDFDVGLLTVQACRTDTGECAQKALASWEQGGNCIQTAQMVIAAYTFALFFSFVTLFLVHYKGECLAKRLKYPRIALFFATSLQCTLYVAAVVIWFQRCQNAMAAGYIVSGLTGDYGKSVTDLLSGYSVAVAIAVIFFSVMAWFFQLWRSCRPRKQEGTSPTSESTSPLAMATSPSSSKTSYRDMDTAEPAQPPPIKIAAAGFTSGGYGVGNTYNPNTYNNDDDAYGERGSGNSQSAYGGYQRGSERQSAYATSAYGY